jgi:hypothetical protein
MRTLPPQTTGIWLPARRHRRLVRDQIAVSQVEANNRGWHIGSRVSLVLPDGRRASVTVAAIYTSRNLAG